MKTYKILLPLRHNGARLAVGETAELPEEDAKPLLDLGYLETTKDEGKEQPKRLPIVAIAELFAAAELPRDKAPTVDVALKTIKAQADSITDPETGYTWHTKDFKINADLRNDAWQLYLAMPDNKDEA